MEIIPAIYLLNGQNVALYKGKIEQKEVYSRSPMEFVRDFVNQGANSLFIVDLNASDPQEGLTYIDRYPGPVRGFPAFEHQYPVES